VNFLFANKGSNIYKLWENYTKICCSFHCSC